MIIRFYLYSFFKNLRFADPFLVLYFLDFELSYSVIGLMLGLQHLATVLLEFPSGILADTWGRCRATSLCFVFYVLSFTGFALTGYSGSISLTRWLTGCLVLFALGEALRTGSHKAIMLDYLDSRGESGQATSLIGRTRAVSKYTAAAAAASGGLLLSWSRDYALLFALSALASLGGFLLMLTYPKELEGDAWRERQQPRDGANSVSIRPPLLMGERRKFWFLFLQSVFFESQLKVVLKYFTQPFLKDGLSLLGIAIIAPSGATGIERLGAAGVGLNEMIRETLGGFGAKMSSSVEGRFRTAATLNGIYVLGLAGILGLAGCSLFLGWGVLPGLLLLSFLTILQNLRRPIFVSTLNTCMEKKQRASILSFESVFRAITVACLLPLYGRAVDALGLPAVWTIASGILTLGLIFRVRPETEATSPGDVGSQ